MLRPQSISLGLCGGLLMATSALGLAGREQSKPFPHATQTAPPSEVPADKTSLMNSFRAANPGTDFEFAPTPGGNRIERVFGPAFSSGQTALDSAERFRTQHSAMFGVPAEDLVPAGTFDTTGSPIPDHIQPIMFIPETGQYKFTGVYYQQGRDGVPVFRSRLMVLVRNEAHYPAVLATADLRDIGTVRVAANAPINQGKGLAAIRNLVPNDAEIMGPTTVLWAGHDNVPAPQGGAVLALQYIAEAPNPAGQEAGPWRWLYLVDAATGALLYEENQVHTVDITGNVQGIATAGYSAWNCPSPEVATNIPFARVTNGTNTTHTDASGNYVLANAGSAPINVTASLQNNNFVTRNAAAANAIPSLIQSVTPPGPANFLFNPSTTEHATAEVNSFIHSNLVRNYVLAFNPTYPTVSTQSNFPINVNIGQTCNAFYSGSTINFYIAGGGCANTGYSSVVYHEFGHNLIEKAGSGQGAYGEGQSDVISIIMQDTPCLGDGFNSCGVCLRSAVNNCNFTSTNCSSCGPAIHTCGQILSGAVWNVRNNLLATNPIMYRSILSNLAVNSMLLHTGSGITNSICIDYLTLDDDDANINNGTPHYSEINSGFTAKAFAGFALALLDITYPNGKPAYVSPAGGTVMRVNVNGVAGTPQPGTGKLFVDIGSGFVQHNMTQVSNNVYDAVFPASPCGSQVKYYVSAQATNNNTVTSPQNAPATSFSAVSSAGAPIAVFADNFQADLGWAVSGNATDGPWERAVPITNCNRGNPLADADGSGACYLTDNSSANACNSDVDGGQTILTSPILDASSAEPKYLSYWRWYDNIDPGNTVTPDDTFLVQFSINGGSNWLPLETIGPTGPEVNGGWVLKQWNLASLPGFAPTSQFRIRFIAQDVGAGHVVEAGVDGIRIDRIPCVSPCPADVTGDTQVNVDDLLAIINAWGPCPGCPADVNSDGNVNADDLLAAINAWGNCP